MSRRKIGMELIKNERSRNSTYQKRKKSLEKKSNELSILCQVKLCMIVYGPKDSEPTIWPDKDTVLSLIYSYRARSDDDKRLRTHDLSFYFRDLTRKVEIESSKLRKRNFEAKYPTWDQHYDSLSSDQLKQLSALLGAKIEFMKQRLELLKGTQTISLENMHAMSFLGKQLTQPNTQCVMQSLVRISSLQLEIIEQQHQQLVPPMNFPETEIMPFGQYHMIRQDNHQISGISTGIPHCTGTGYEPHLAMLNASGNVIESQRMCHRDLARDNNMLFSNNVDQQPQPLCYFVPMATPNNYFHQYHPMLPNAATSYQMHTSETEEYYEVGDFQLPNLNK
ncbi:floral homeotic protein PMADS 2-like [Nicotiana tomentosiformis]|uniref:floral homeotic protein PMADS 2-like n=1 Tax=Nicotiana tomentosiformis TaxID=4098 RepID=UPI00051BA5B2|nr:floral homeotic protein GLOBOSA-like [Nicotiana tomentosiformis]